MAGSQLKRLKSSLREQGIVGPQKSKKQKKKAAEEARARGSQDKRLKRSEALASIREQFNPFQFKMNARGPKFPVTSLRAKAEGLGGIKGRPQVALSRSEERRRNTLLVDMQRRNKVGGILDRRLGEGDPNMTPEERALERFAFEKQRLHRKKGAMFDLEDDDGGFGDGEGLTHMGRSLALDDDDGDNKAAGARGKRDDFDEDDLPIGSDDDDDGDDDGISYKKKRKRMLDGADFDAMEALARGEGAGEGDGEEQPGRKKTKKEVMEEVIAKSKFHKYERQAVREADDDVRAELDKMLPELQQLLVTKPVPASTATAAGKMPALPVDKDALDKAYDVRLRQMLQDQKAEPSARTKTEEERAAEQSAHLQKLEESRMKRMRGELDEEQEEEERAAAEAEAAEAAKKQKKKDDEAAAAVQILQVDDDSEEDEFQLGKGIRARPTAAELGFDDEDDFLIDDDLVASGSEMEVDDEDFEYSEGEEGGSEMAVEEEDDNDNDDDDDDEFTQGLLTEEEKRDPSFAAKTGAQGRDDDGVPYTFPCPASHDEFLDLVRAVPVAKRPVVVQRIRALYHPKLDHGNKARLGQFAGVLIEHMAYLADTADAKDASPYATIESLARHVHSLAKTVPADVANAFRAHLAATATATATAAAATAGRPTLTPGDLAVLTAVALFPTSDHFHQAVTPAQLAMARYLAHAVPRTLADYATGLYVCTLLLQFQARARRYVPELVPYAANALLALAPAPCTDAATLQLLAGCLPVHASAAGVRLSSAMSSDVPGGDLVVRKLRPTDCVDGDGDGDEADDTDRKAALLNTALALLAEATALWADKAALYETLVPVAAVLRHVRGGGGAATPSKRSAQSPPPPPPPPPRLPAALQQAADRTAAQVAAAQAAATRARRPLALHGWRPLAIRTAVPRFEDAFDPDKHYDPDRERAEAAKLQADYRRERKGALRELRRDAGFLAREKLKAKKARDAAYEKKYKRLVAEIQGQEGQEANAYERERQARKRK